MLRRNILHSPLLWLAVLLATPFLPLLVFPNGRVIGNPACDNPKQFYYFHEFAGQCWREGIIPLWNPHAMLGFPLVADGIASVFHPLSFLFVFMPAGMALNWLVAICFVLSGIFFYGWLRTLDLRTEAAYLGAVFWCFSNVLINRIHAGHLSILLTVLEIPLVMMLWERYRRTRRIAWLAGLGIAYGVMILAAYPQVHYYFSLFFMLYVLMQSAQACTSGAAARRESVSIMALGIFVVLGAGTGAIQLFPMADFLDHSYRRTANYEFCSSFFFPAHHALTFLVPRIFGYNTEIGTSFYWGRDNYWEMTSYIGLLPLALVIPGFLAAPRPRRITFGVCAIVFFVLALGAQTPLFRFLYDNFPFFNGFRGIGKTIILTEFCLITLAAYAIDGMLNEIGGERKLLKATITTLAAVLLALIGMYAWFVPGAETGSHWQALLQNGSGSAKIMKPDLIHEFAGWTAKEIMHAISICAATLVVLALVFRTRSARSLTVMILLITLADLLGVFVPLMATYPESIASIPKPLIAPLRTKPYPSRGLAPASLVNTPMHHGLSSASGFLANSLGRYNDYVNAILRLPLTTAQLVDPLPVYSPKMKIMAVEWMIVPLGIAPAGKVIAQADGRALLKIEDGFPRVWLASAPIKMTRHAALDYVQNQNNDLQANPVIEHPAAEIVAKPLGPGEDARIVRFSPNRVELETNAAQPRVMVVSEIFEHNWKATVNGKPADLFPADYILRGVTIPAGSSRIVMEYRPRSFWLGAMISGLCFIALVAAGIANLARRTRSQ